MPKYLRYLGIQSLALGYKWAADGRNWHLVPEHCPLVISTLVIRPAFFRLGFLSPINRFFHLLTASLNI